MINSRNPDDLHPRVRDKAIELVRLCKEQNIDLLITSTYRDSESQAELYAQGRTKPGRIITNAKPGWSWHNWKCAFDVVPIRNGKCVWDTKDEVWQVVGKLGESVGLEWAGRWTRFKEYPHFQYTGGLTLADLNKGKAIV